MKKVLLVATGGTIASQETGQGLAPTISSDALISYVPQIADYCHMDAVQPVNIDSLNAQPEDWIAIAKAIQSGYDDYDGFVVAHGTDTLGYTSAALSYLIQHSSKPIVVTGSQKPIDEPGNDAVRNLLDAVKVAVSGRGGVYAVFAGEIMAGTRARKIGTKSLKAFESVNFPPLGTALRKEILFYNDTEKQNQSKFYSELNTSVAFLKLVPGLEPEILEYLSGRYQGIVIETYGAGGLPAEGKRNFYNKLGDIVKQDTVVVIGTQVFSEGTDMIITEVGQKTLNSYSVLETLDMNIETAYIKLMWILSLTNDPNEIKKLFYTPVNYDICCRIK